MNKLYKYNHFDWHNKGGHKLTTLYDCNDIAEKVFMWL